MVGCRLDLTPGREIVPLDLDCQSPLVWTGPGVAPLAVAAVYWLHGPLAMIEHPGLALVRRQAASCDDTSGRQPRDGYQGIFAERGLLPGPS
jgi:hypothetical protein